MSDRLRIDLSPSGVAHVCLTRGERMNALDSAMFDALLAAQGELAAMPRLRAVVISGEGRAFCAGLDLSNFQQLMAGGRPLELMSRTHGLANAPQQVVIGWRQLAVPVVAALHGVVYGGGLQIALGADWRIAAPDTRLSVKEVVWGLVPDMGGMVLMRETLRGDVMRELTYSGRDVGAEEALAIGLVTRIAEDPLAAALAWAEELAGRSPAAVRAAKRLLNAALEGDSVAELLLGESREQSALMGSAEQIETVTARLHKRAPNY